MPKEKVKPSAEQEIRRVLNEQGPEKSGLSDNFTLALAGILPTVVGSLFAGSRGAEVGANVGLGAMQQYGNQLNRQAQMDADKERFRKEQLIRGALSDIPEELTPYQQEQLALDKRGLALREKQFAAEQQAMQTKAETPKEEKFSEPQLQSAGFAKRLEQSESIFDSLEKSGYERAGIAQGLLSELPSFANILKPKELQMQEQAERNFVNAVLRKESGSAISKEEFANAETQYFPRAGDSAEVVKQKKQNRLQAMENLKGSAGGAIEKVKSAEEAPKAEALSPFKKRLNDILAKRKAK